MSLTGIDYEGRITNWGAVRRAGHSFAVTRVIGENGALDPDAIPNIKGAWNAGLIPGGYHFIAHGTAVEHCKRFKDAIAPFLDRPFLVQLDAERPNFHPNPRMADIRAWFGEWRRDYPERPVLAYIPEWYIDGVLGETDKLADLTPYWWNSRYVTGDTPGEIAEGWARSAGGWKSPTVWQYRGSTRIGAGAAVDLNITRLSIDQLRGLATARVLPESDTEAPVEFAPKIERWTLDGATEVTTLGSPLAADGSTDFSKRLAIRPYAGNLRMDEISRDRLTNPKDDKSDALLAALTSYALPDPDKAATAAADAVLEAAKDAAAKYGAS